LICPLIEDRSYAGMLDLTEGRRDKNAVHQKVMHFVVILLMNLKCSRSQAKCMNNVNI